MKAKNKETPKLKKHKPTVKRCMHIVSNTFDEHREKLVHRMQTEQRMVGDLLTVMESEIKNELKKLLK